MVYGYMIQPTKKSEKVIIEGVVLEFDLKESIKSMISKIKRAIYNLLDKLEHALSKCKDSSFKSFLMKIIAKLKSLFKEADNIQSVADANHVRIKIVSINGEIDEWLKKLYDADIELGLKEHTWLRLRIRLGNGILVANATELKNDLNYLKGKCDIFAESAKEVPVDIPVIKEPDYENISSSELEDLFAYNMIYYKDGNAFTEENTYILRRMCEKSREKRRQEKEQQKESS